MSPHVAVRSDLAFQAFFRRGRRGEEQPGSPRVRGQRRAESIPFAPMPVGGTLERETKRLRMRNGGHGKGVLHRPLEGTPKTATMQRSSTGTWTVSFSCACVEPLPVPATGQDVGSDVGPKPFAGLSTGNEIASPRFFREEEQALAKAQRRRWNEAKGREGNTGTSKTAHESRSRA